MAQAKNIGYTQFQLRFSTEDACRNQLFEMRFPLDLYVLFVVASTTTTSAQETYISAKDAGISCLLHREL